MMTEFQLYHFNDDNVLFWFGASNQVFDHMWPIFELISDYYKKHHN